MSGAPVVVLGAGCAGLSAARRLRELGRPVLVVEAADHVGGLAGGVRMGGDVYEYGPHIFHTTDAAIMGDVKALVGPELLPYRRTILIKFLGSWFNFPLSIGDVLLKLPPATTLKAGFSFLWHALAGRLSRPKEENSETVLRREYGDVLYRLFFKDYIEKVWGVPPSMFSPSFARERIPRFNLLEVLDKASAALKRAFGLGAAVTTEGFVEKVEGSLFTTRRGFSLICDKMGEALQDAGGRIRLNAKVVGLRREGGRVAAVELETPAGARERALLGRGQHARHQRGRAPLHPRAGSRGGEGRRHAALPRHRVRGREGAPPARAGRLLRLLPRARLQPRDGPVLVQVRAGRGHHAAGLRDRLRPGGPGLDR
jgi:protoporphyrinogen oxidase